MESELNQAAGYEHAEAVDEDHVVIRSNGAGEPQVEARDGGEVVEVVGCGG